MRALLCLLLLLVTACSMVKPTSTPLGTEQNPLKLALAPATDTQKALTAGEPLLKLLVQETGLRIRLSVPTSHAAVIEAMGTHNVDVGWLAPLAYVLAHDRVGAEVLVANVRGGSATSQEPPIDATTLSGMPPDLREQVRTLVRAEPVPNDAVAIRSGVPPEVARNVRDGLLRVAATPAGSEALRHLYGIDGLAPAADADFSSLRAVIRLLDLDLDAELAPPRRGT